MPFKQLLTQHIGRRILFAFFLLSSMLTALSIAFILFTQYTNEKRDIINDGQNLINSRIDSLSSILWNFDLALANVSIKSLSDSPNISYIAIIDDKNAVFSSSGDITAPYSSQVEIPLTKNVNNAIRKIGSVKAHITIALAKEHVKGNFLNILFIQALKSIVTSFFFLLLIYHIIIKHINKITREIITDSNDGTNFLTNEIFLERPYRDDELQCLVDTLNKNKQSRNNYLKKLTKEARKRKKAEKKATTSHHELLHVLNSLTVAVFSCKHDGEIVFMNYNALRLLDHHDASRATTNDSLYINSVIKIHKDKKTSASGDIDIIAKSQESEYATKIDAYYPPVNGEETFTPIELTVIPTKSTTVSKNSNFIVVIKDRTQKEKLDAMTHMVSHDYLTKIYNRMYLTEEINKKLSEKTGDYSLALIDLDKFKAVNDNGGHAAGDQLLQLIANTIPQLLGPNDTFARIGGDEFSILFNSNSSNSRKISLEIIRRLENLNFTYNGKIYPTSCSIGISDLRPEDDKVEQVMSRADKACYQAKNQGRGTAVIYQKPISKQDATVTALHKERT